MIEKKIYTIEELKDVPLFELRLLLRELGGKPGTKNISKIKEEIIAIQSGKLIPKPSNRGRKPKISPSDKEMLTDEKAGNEKIEGDTKQEKTAEYLPFYKRGDSDKIYQSANAYVPLTLRVCDIEGENISEVIIAEGVLEILPDGDGYLRTYEYGINRKEFHLDKKIIKTYELLTGDYIVGYAVNQEAKCEYLVYEITQINGIDRESFVRNEDFDKLFAVYPFSKLFSSEDNSNTIRSLDLICPIAKGQRALIVAPSGVGKTTLLKEMAQSISEYGENLHLITLLLDTTPEEISDFSQNIKTGELVVAPFDMHSLLKVKQVELSIERAKRLVENGKDVVVLIDSLSKLVRAYNCLFCNDLAENLDKVDLQSVINTKKIFASARKIKQGGSLTIIASLSADDNLFDKTLLREFLEFANAKIILSKTLFNQFVFPALDIFNSCTTKCELILSQEELIAERKIKTKLKQNERATEIVFEMIKRSKNNLELAKKLDDWLKSILE